VFVNRAKRALHTVRLGLGILLVAAVVVVTVLFYRELRQQLYTERQTHLTELTVKITEVLDTTVSAQQSKATSAQRLLETMEFADTDELFYHLHRLAGFLDLSDAALLVMDSRGQYYTADGGQGRWESTDDLLLEDPYPVIRELTLAGTKATYMVFFSRLEDGPSVGTGPALTHAAVAVPLSGMQEAFTISVFGDRCDVCLINPDGRRLYRQTSNAAFLEEYNILSALEAAKFYMGGSVTELEEAVRTRTSCCLEFQNPTDEVNYFVSTVPLQDADWTVLLFVPTSVLGANTTNVMNFVIAYFTAVAVILMIVFTLLMSAAMTNRNDRALMAKQEEANRYLAQAADDASAASAAKSEFLSHMSHDIRTPINGIVGMTSIAMKEVDDPNRVRECLGKIGGAADHLLTLVNDVLDMSRIESGRIEIARDPMDIRTVIENCNSIISGQLLSRQLTFVRDIEDICHPYLFGDELHLRQVFINILGNAVKFTPDGGTVTFRVRETRATETDVHYVFTVSDTGIGMSEEFQKRIFEPFSQEDNGSRTTYQGTGLGMAITKQFVELMGGTIAVASAPDRGSCFTVELDFAIDHNSHHAAGTAAACDIQGMKLLVVEDNELNLEIAVALLEDAGAAVDTAENGREAVDRFLSAAPGTYDAILMDVMMPVMNGYEATRAIRASTHPEAMTVPIIAMTANAYTEDVQQALSAGMSAHVAKPIEMERLFAVLREFQKP
jgi:signal transduction histidine kinase/ActR/RegA family two-component response regulator